MKTLKRPLLFILSLLHLMIISCGDSENSNQMPESTLPSAKIQCSNISATYCSSANNNSPVFIGFTEDHSISCESFLAGKNRITDLHADFEASANSSLTFDTSSSLVGEIGKNEYKDPLNQSLYFLQDLEYTICGFIDINNNNFLNFNEPVLSQKIRLGDLDFAELVAWSDY